MRKFNQTQNLKDSDFTQNVSLRDSGIFLSKEQVVEEELTSSREVYTPQTVKKLKVKVVEKKKKDRPSTELGDMKLKMLKMSLKESGAY